MKKAALLKFIKVVLINLVVLFVLLEAASLGAYFFRTRELFYFRTKARVDASVASLDSEASPPGARWRPPFMIHPYFGYVYRPGTAPPHYSPGLADAPYLPNNQGFLSPHAYPFRKSNRNQFIVGVFGGSVAGHYSVYELEHHVLSDALNGTPRLRDREIIVLNFAVNGYKQPQQLLVLNYFLSVGQEFDAVINIDGFNEVASAQLNNGAGMDVSMPVNTVVNDLAALADKDFSPKLIEVAESRNALREAYVKLNNCRLATCYTLRWLQVQYLYREYRERVEANARRRVDERAMDPLVYLGDVAVPLGNEEAVERAASIWADASLQMKELLSARGIPYFHFIQPNQYYPTGRRFSDEERKVAINESNQLQIAAHARSGYPKLLSKIGELRESGVNVFNAAGIFDEVQGSVYADDCCHYSPAGNEVLAKYVARTILGILQ